MSAARKKTPAPAARPARTTAWLAAALRGSARHWLIAALMIVALAGVWHWVWRDVRANVLSAADYAITADDLAIPPPPSWIHCDIRKEAFGSASLNGRLSLLDPDLAKNTATAFTLHPWVASVRSVRKQYPSCVQVDLTYRRPVLMVATKAGAVPVDGHGIVLPSRDFSAADRAEYPMLYGIESVPLGAAGERWNDARVLGAADIAAFLGPACQTWKIARVWPSAQPVSSASDDYVFMLETRAGSQIPWGHPPSNQVVGELSAAEKLKRLQREAEKYRSLDGRDGRAQNVIIENLPAT